MSKNNERAKVRNCKELGSNLIKIFSILKKDQDLLRLLYYTDKDPLNKEKPDITDEQYRSEIYEKLMKVTPRLGPKETAQSVISILINEGNGLPENNEFSSVNFDVEIFTPLDQWIIKDTNLRIFAIMGRIQEDLRGIKIDGLGKISGGDFELDFLTDEIGAYILHFNFLTYD